MTKVIGIPTEIKLNEARVALVPEDCARLVRAGVTVLVQAGAGNFAGYADADYAAVGVTVVPTAAALYQQAEVIVKVKEPQAGDIALLEERHTLFGYLHLAAEPALTRTLQNIGLTAVAFETVVVEEQTPLLAPMSAIAGRLSVQIGTWYLHTPRGGRGVLLGGIQGVSAGQVLVIGAGVAGTEAAILAQRMGAKVTVADINEAKLQALAKQLPGINTVVSSEAALTTLLPTTDLLVGAVYVVGKKAPTVITKEMMALLPKGAVAMDIAIDQGGCFATSHACTHIDPMYEVEGVLHSAITNLPAAAPHTASAILSAAIAPYVQELAQDKWSQPLQEAVNVADGALKITFD